MLYCLVFKLTLSFIELLHKIELAFAFVSINAIYIKYINKGDEQDV